MTGMAVPTIALYASPPSSVCSLTYQINSHTTHDFDLNSRSSSSSSSSSSVSHKQIIDGLSCLFSSSSEIGSYSHRGENLKELSSSFGYSFWPTKFCGASSSLKRDQSPVSVFQGPISNNSYSRSSPPIRIAREKSDVSVNFQSSLKGTSGLFNGFVRHALGSCMDYDSALSYRVEDGGLNVGSPVLGDELTFNMEENDNLVEDKLKLESYAKDFLADAQAKHRIFFDDFVVKAFYEAEKAHRGQMRASGDPYLQHCVETTVLLAKIGANSTVVAAGLLHDTLDDSFLSYDHIFRTFGARVADLVEGVWEEVPGKLKDCITHPKFNGYQSLHTVVMGEGMVPLEVQIRTKKMHSQAEFGFAAHWRYKEGDCKHSSFVLQMVEWARWVLTWQCETMSRDCSSVGYADSIKPPSKFPSHADDCPYSYKPQCSQDGPVFVIMIENEKMSVQEFPANSSIN